MIRYNWLLLTACQRSGVSKQPKCMHNAWICATNTRLLECFNIYSLTRTPTQVAELVGQKTAVETAVENDPLWQKEKGQTICDICGCIAQSTDNDQRKQNHLDGKSFPNTFFAVEWWRLDKCSMEIQLKKSWLMSQGF